MDGIKGLFQAMCLMLAAWLLLGGCAYESGDSSDSGGTGTLVLSLSDAPVNADNIAGVWITITGIEYKLNNKWTSLEGDFDGGPHNLLQLTGGNSSLLGQLTLEAGEYKNIRFQLDAPDEGESAPANPGSYIEFSDGSANAALFVPSGAQTGYKALGDFAIPANGTVDLTADFDARKAVVEAGSKFILKPTIRLIVTDEAGAISGAVTNLGANGVVVHAYEADTYAASEETAGSNDNAFPNAVSSSNLVQTEGGTYTVAFLSAAFAYDLVIAEYDADGTATVLGSLSGITVTSGATTTADIDLSAL